MTIGLRPAGLLALIACGWIGADGLRRAGLEGPFARAALPWDANRLPESASDARVLALRPVSPFARFRDALTRADGPDGTGFRTAARGVLRWGRNQPGTLLDLGRVALERWKARGEAEDREVGEALLLEFVRRTTHAETEAVVAWQAFAAPTDDAFARFQAAPAAAWPVLGVALAPTHPVAAWRFLEPSLRDRTLDPRYAGAVVTLARKRRQPGDLGVLKALAAREDLAPGVRPDLLALIADLEGGR